MSGRYVRYAMNQPAVYVGYDFCLERGPLWIFRWYTAVARDWLVSSMLDLSREYF